MVGASSSLTKSIIRVYCFQTELAYPVVTLEDFESGDIVFYYPTIRFLAR